MKLYPGLKALVIIGAGIGGLWVMRGDAPATTARLKCESHLETATGHDLSAGEVSAMTVTGDAQNGKVQGAFIRNDELRSAVCEFENARTTRVAIDGKTQ
ncbi:hypothetical protein [Ancylobacter sp. FA202]|uniref:hypothetical protein n=1 Tax=Ancylobacter sp. FA202 TaxID=1111106 RepID=UPI00036F8420|nr:hypothetical protein [Ancylobacter sp. FA202]